MIDDDTVSMPICDVEEAAHAFSTVGVEMRVERIKDRSAFSVNFKDYPMGGTQLVRTSWGTDSWLKVDLIDRVAVVVNPYGSAPSIFTVSGDKVAASTRTAPVIQPEKRIDIFRPAGTPLLVLSASLKELERLFGEIAGIHPGRLDFEPGLNLESPEGRRLQQLISFTLGELSANPRALDNPILRHQLDDLVLSGILSLPGNHHRLLDPSNSSAGVAVVRRAEEFMEAHVDHPITMSDVAAACDCSRTKLFLAFKRDRAWTPLQFLVRRRMERARRRLLAPTPGTTVTRVSLDCGYTSLSRFAQEYRRLFGETPSMTLNRSR